MNRHHVTALAALVVLSLTGACAGQGATADLGSSVPQRVDPMTVRDGLSKYDAPVTAEVKDGLWKHEQPGPEDPEAPRVRDGLSKYER